MRKKVAYLSGDISALERLVGTLLGHLDRAIQPDCTDQERVRYRAMVNDIRGALAEGDEAEKNFWHDCSCWRGDAGRTPKAKGRQIAAAP